MRRLPYPPARVLTPAEETRTTGLVVAPRLEHGYTGVWSFTGTWTVLHRESGYPATTAGPTGLGHARDLATLLGELGIDWTREKDRLPLHDPAARSAVHEARNQIRAAAKQARPARLVHSWQQAPLLYWLGPIDGEPVAHFRTFTDAADYATAHHTPRHEHRTVIGRDEAPWWGLRCAAADCGIEFDLDEGWCPHRSELAGVARDNGWRRLGPQHWLCPTCIALFTPAYPF